MSNTSDFQKEELLGKIFYSAAKADNVIKPEEMDRFMNLIADYWSDEFHSISDQFFECVNVSYPADKVFGEIKIAKELYPDEFNKVFIEEIMTTTYQIANATAGTNKSEVVFISKLRSTLEG